MPKFDLKEHDERMRRILHPPQPLSPLPPETLDRLVGIARQWRGGELMPRGIPRRQRTRRGKRV